MRVLVNSWRDIWMRHIRQTIKHDDIRLKISRTEHLPYLSLLWNITNNSMTEVEITRICGDIYVGDNWCIASFESRESPVEWKAGNLYPPQVTCSHRYLKKPKDGAWDNRASVEIRIFPPIEFWLIGRFECSLWNGFAEIKTNWGKVKIPIDKSSMKIENIEQGSSLYKARIKELLASID